ncbi:GNAT family N-acetyltransferase [Rhizobiaceae bacterium n13]|uniref:GNAT family N-acetyltransferase n=1 Tax=Ferirhizobium litorale TaxID=2927786 RepID=A0AAE3QKX4_9HYPH|nr:GNAT family N-acetyltransferase [Fererhizobium litorale]MDI7864771.1 GNAT family N-acetyltransferase [Fererhizobium litorale]MDI7924948.1 GNAT family N-acetyltransferase [Fererhizobium litorale]
MTAAAQIAGLTFRQDYFDDPQGWCAISDLLLETFGVDISPLDKLGGHDRTNLPSAFFDDGGRCIANLSAFSMPLMIDGGVVRAAGLQSGAVRPEYRGRGLFRELIRITLARCEAHGYEALVLYTDKPGLYEPHGFVTIPQQHFRGPPPPPLPRGAVRPMRPLRIDDPEDLALIKRVLAERTPVSSRFAVTAQSEMFLLNSYLVSGTRLAYLHQSDAVVAWRQSETRGFELLDIAGQQIPALATILAALDAEPGHVTVHVPPDRLEWEGTPEAAAGDLVFMVRGTPSLIPDKPFCLSPMAEF